MKIELFTKLLKNFNLKIKMLNRVACPYHPDANLIEDYHAGDMICSMCGLVVGDRVIDVGKELFFFVELISWKNSKIYFKK